MDLWINDWLIVNFQDIVLTPGQLDGSVIPLKFVKFQNVQNVQFFIKVTERFIRSEFEFNEFEPSLKSDKTSVGQLKACL